MRPHSSSSCSSCSTATPVVARTRARCHSSCGRPCPPPTRRWAERRRKSPPSSSCCDTCSLHVHMSHTEKERERASERERQRQRERHGHRHGTHRRGVKCEGWSQPAASRPPLSHLPPIVPATITPPSPWRAPGAESRVAANGIETRVSSGRAKGHAHVL